MILPRMLIWWRWCKRQLTSVWKCIRLAQWVFCDFNDTLPRWMTVNHSGVKSRSVAAAQSAHFSHNCSGHVEFDLTCDIVRLPNTWQFLWIWHLITPFTCHRTVVVNANLWIVSTFKIARDKHCTCMMTYVAETCQQTDISLLGRHIQIGDGVWKSTKLLNAACAHLQAICERSG